MVVDNAVLVIIVEAGVLAPVFGAAVSKELAIITNFYFNDRWTFAGHNDKNRWHRLANSNINRLGGLVISIVILYTLHTYLEIWYLFANIAGIGAGFVVNYVSESVITWRVHE